MPSEQIIEQPSVWQKNLANAIRDPQQLLNELGLEDKDKRFSRDAHQQFRLLAPQSYVEKMRKQDWNDPLLRQVLPLNDEMQMVDGFGIDPVGDQDSMVSNGLLHKYQGRVLIVTTGACAIHCRYCFRRHFPYGDASPSKDNLGKTLSYIASDSRIKEVILSGGDPLVLSDSRLKTLCYQIAEIPHVKRLRLHTRLPIVLPERIDDNFLSWFKKLPLQKVMVIHANHAQELDENTAIALSCIKATDTLLLNQSVLLKGVNDSINALSTLSESLIEQNVIPYYLHVLDRVQGAAHYEVDSKEAKELIRQLRNCLSGYMVPKLVREVSGKAAKQPIEL